MDEADQLHSLARGAVADEVILGRALNKMEEEGPQTCGGRESLGDKSTEARSRKRIGGHSTHTKAVSDLAVRCPCRALPWTVPCSPPVHCVSSSRPASAHSFQNAFFSAYLLSPGLHPGLTKEEGGAGVQSVSGQ